jgi:hypothetical protein
MSDTRWDDWQERMMNEQESHESRMRTLHEISEEKLRAEADAKSLAGHHFAIWEAEQEDWWVMGCPTR